MNNVFKVFLSLSLSGSLMILILFLGRHFWKDRISRQWQYYIWLLVIARLLLPFAPEMNLVGHVLQTVDSTSSQTEPQPQQWPIQEQDGNSRPLIPAFGSQPIQDIVTLLANHIWLVWLVAALLLLVRKITVYQSFVHYVKAGWKLVSDVELLDRFSVLAGEAGVEMPVELGVNPLISSPLLIGFFRPCIVLPGTDLSEHDFRYTVLHELTHCRRRDMFYKWLVQVTVCLHWFNPLVYVMSREINRACEFSCDEAVIKKLEDGGPQEYGKTLLHAMNQAGTYGETLASVTLNENKEMLKERIGAIMSAKKKSGLRTAGTLLLTVMLLCAAVFTGAYAATAEDGVSDGAVINLTNNPGQTNIIHSSSFEAEDGQVLTLEIKSNVKGSVDLFLFSPSYEEQRITIGGSDETRTVSLSKGTWAYNCTGFFDSGDITIVGTIQ